LLGLTGKVDETAITRLLSARDPATGEPLRGPLTAGSVAGFDPTFRAPKSVSVLFGIAEDAVAAELRDGHEAAVAEALGYLELEACIVRRGHGEAVELRAGGFVGAAFRHRSSRAGDPLLHTHVVIANAARGPDGRWTALYGRPIYAHAKTAGYLYQAVCGGALPPLGLEWQPVERGAADVRGVSRHVVEHFSQRRHEILEAMATRGEHSARAAQVATLDTRRAKRLEPYGDQRADWRARAAEHGLCQDDVGPLLQRAAHVTPSPADPSRP
jgi:conjugative relaxase-like TrwC/TraI family protein